MGVIDTAKAMVGKVDYVWGGDTPRGVDCSGLTELTYGLNGVRIPRTSREQKRAGTQIRLQDAQPGDLLLYTYFGSPSNPPPANHVGLYVQPGWMIDAARPGTKVRYDPIDMAHLDSVVHISGSVPTGPRANAINASATVTATPADSSWPGNILGTLGDVLTIPFTAGPSIIGGAVSGVAGSILQGVLVAVGPIMLTGMSILFAGGLIMLGLWRMSQNTEAGRAAGSAVKDAAKVAAVA